MLFHNIGCPLNWTMVREYYIHTWEGNAVSLSVPEPKAVYSLWLPNQAPHYLPILGCIWGKNVLTLEGQWSQEQLISTGTDCPVSSPSRCLGWRQRWGAFSVSYSEKWKFESERWSKASKGRCNWADLDRLPGNIKQQQLWRRVIASLGLCNALSSL